PRPACPHASPRTSYRRPATPRTRSRQRVNYLQFLSRMTELALSRGAQAIAIGRGNSPAARRATAGFARRWEATGGIIIGTVTWPESAASWLRQATRFAAADPDLWVMAGPATGWAQMTRRLLWSTPWRPERTIAFAAIGTGHVIGL